ncbi:MAG: hydantoinase/oxoprolinase family protein [Gammaproteobacteria bacterium]|nr:hydantoinase/oxoprolinase family protein [Gammaproteobacteria bacterium]
MGFRVGVDIGGTFTDFCAFDEDSLAIHTLKVPSTPEEPGAEVLMGLTELQRRYGIEARDITYFTHGTTVGVNTVIQRKGVNLCLFTTENFVDVLELARLKTPDPYDLHSMRPPPLVSKERVLPIRERMTSAGATETQVDESSVLAALARAKHLRAEGIVLAFINAYRNGAHERQVKAIIAQHAPELPVFCSSDVWSIIREYERTITACIHGYVQPRVSHYLGSLQTALANAGVPAEAMVTKSNGGVMSAELGKTQCAQMILSGTASGVIGASYIAALSGYPDTMSLDIGGTSADVAFLRDGQPQYGVGELIGEYPIYIPSVAVTSIGAGGGSIAWVDELGLLKVGPESAGSTPGPACYNKGGDRPTVTDAFAVLGFIGQHSLGYDAIEVDVDRARTAIETVAKPIGLDVESTAQAIVDIAVSGMYMEVSKLISRYGVDPRELAMQAFGGAGPMMASFLARELGMADVVIPPTPGVLSALGGLIADIKNDFISTVFLDLNPSSVQAMQDEFAALVDKATAWLREEQGHSGQHHFLYSADMRYRGQSFELESAIEPRALETGQLDAIAEAFHAEHERVYEHADRGAEVQVINLRLVVVGTSVKPSIPAAALETGAATASDSVKVFIGGKAENVQVYERERLRPGHSLRGPAIVAQPDTTTCILPGMSARVDAYGNLLLRFEDEANSA